MRIRRKGVGEPAEASEPMLAFRPTNSSQLRAGDYGQREDVQPKGVQLPAGLLKGPSTISSVHLPSDELNQGS